MDLNIFYSFCYAVKPFSAPPFEIRFLVSEGLKKSVNAKRGVQQLSEYDHDTGTFPAP